MNNEAADAIETMCEMVATAHGELANVIQSYEEIKSRWIPVTERLPEGGIQVLVCSGFFAPFTEVAFYDGLWFSAWDGNTEIEAVTHWMPLPEPPKEET